MTVLSQLVRFNIKVPLNMVVGVLAVVYESWPLFVEELLSLVILPPTFNQNVNYSVAGLMVVYTHKKYTPLLGTALRCALYT